ncbi:acylphosphatase, partial [Limnoraphis robusta CCNP1324]|uniref:acylphosphatase n=1 Tax=Limnoraphis robusta TaxID=1118279 RepID=UPI002B206BF0
GMASGIETSEVIRITGTVQGVGFRPAVYRLARRCGLQGSVRNDGHGVLIEVGGASNTIEWFLRELTTNPPPMAAIAAIERQPSTVAVAGAFRIAPSRGGTPETEVAPDAACCADCLAELWDDAGRRHRYAFTNCTHCGPRLSIIRGIPYDRVHTSMSPFPLCPDCREEFDDPADRRFHAQATACPACGPRLDWRVAPGQAGGSHLRTAGGAGLDPLQLAVEALRDGRIVAVKGLGGFQLACMATDARAVEALRRRKRRPHKPLALMALDLAMVEQYCEVSEAERALLQSPAAPIVLLRVHTPGRL